MINRALLLIVPAFLTASSAGADSVSYDGDNISNCLAFPAVQEFVTDIVRIVVRASGTVEVNTDITLKPCKPVGERRVSRQR
jgi:hypothetical protein